MAWRNDRVIEAGRYERPKEMRGPHIATHAGVVVRTEKDDRFLIHNTLEAGVVATPAQNMSSNWYKTQDLEVNGYKTVQDALRGGYTPGSARLGKVGEYLASGTCQFSANNVAEALKK